MSKETKDENLAFVFPPNQSKRIKALQKKLGVNSAGEVLMKALALLEITAGKKVEIRGKDKTTYEIQDIDHDDSDIEEDNL